MLFLAPYASEQRLVFDSFPLKWSRLSEQIFRVDELSPKVGDGLIFQAAVAA